jgi:putative transposase
VTIVERNRDTKFTKSFDTKLQSQRVKVIKNPILSPNMTAFDERFIQSIKTECLDHFIVFGESHLNHLCNEYLAHYHDDRPHQGMDNERLVKPKSHGRPPTKPVTIAKQIVPLAEVRCKQRLGGLLKSYSRKAA